MIASTETIQVLMDNELRSRVYSNAGNSALLAMAGPGHMTVLDVGCGAGDNAAALKVQNPDATIFGITASPEEAALASVHMARCWVTDLEAPLPNDVSARSYDLILCSHVLEHLRNPAEVLHRLSSLLRPQGSCLVAVPNVMNWRERARFVFGRFEYEQAGVMDDTHLRFFSFETADRYLFSKSIALRVVQKTVTGSVPLWIFRRNVLPAQVSNAIDRFGCRLLPNLFGGQVLIKAIKDR